MVGMRSELGVARVEDNRKISPFAENVVHVPSPLRIPAVLRTETADLALVQGLVKLFFQ